MSIILDGTNGESFPTWTVGTRPASPIANLTGYNTTNNTLETYNGTAWVNSNLPVPTSAGNVVFTIDGTNWTSSPKLTYQTVRTLSGVNEDFTVPSWVKRITVMVVGSTVSPIAIQLGTASGIVTSGYYSYWGSILGTTSTVAGGSNTANLVFQSQCNVGNAVITNLSGDTWVSNFTGRSSDRVGTSYGSITLSTGSLTTIRFVTTATSGSINVIYE